VEAFRIFLYKTGSEAEIAKFDSHIRNVSRLKKDILCLNISVGNVKRFVHVVQPTQQLSNNKRCLPLSQHRLPLIKRASLAILKDRVIFITVLKDIVQLYDTRVVKLQMKISLFQSYRRIFTFGNRFYCFNRLIVPFVNCLMNNSIASLAKYTMEVIDLFDTYTIND
jgi:hypothetical protein